MHGSKDQAPEIKISEHDAHVLRVLQVYQGILFICCDVLRC